MDMAKPKIRFKGYTDDWEQRKLGTVTQEFKSGNSLKADNISESGEYPVYGGNGLRGYTSTCNHDGEFALIGRQGALCGNMNYSIGKAYFTEHAVVVEANEKNNTRFIYYMLDTMNLGQYSDQSAQPGLAVNKLIKLENMFPRKEEQVKIGNYFQSLDHLITLHQCKCHLLHKLLHNDWEQRKLGDDLVSIHTGTNLLGSITNTGMPLIKMGNIQRGYFDTSKVEFLTENEQPDKADIANYGDFFFNTRNTLELVGKGATWMKNSGEYAFNSNIARFELRNLDTIFFNYLYNTDYMTKQIHARAMGTTSVAAIYPRTLDSVEYLAPCMKEQQKIGAYFKQLDHLITLHQRKCEEIKKLKKYMLQKMFPQNGQTVPKIRFSGFTDAWEQRKLIDYLVVSSEKNRDNRFTKDDVLSVSGEYGIVNQIEFQGRSFAGASVSNYGVVENGDVVYTKSPLKSNPYGIIKTNKGIPGIVSTLYAVYKPKEITDSKFVQIYFELDSRMNSYMHPLVNKGAKNDMKVSAENALKGMVSFPKKDEQEMISLYFSTLDHFITLHQHKCEQLQSMKKFMLQNMFV